MKAILLLNTGAGSIAQGSQGDISPRTLHEAFASDGISITTHQASGPAFDPALRQAIARAPDALFIGGGDGTVSAAANQLVGTGIPLGVVPLGTLNHFARDLGLPAAWRDAVRALTAGTRRWVDVGEVNERVFINNCSIGSYAQAVQRRDALRRERGHGKTLAMVLASFAVFRGLRRLRLTIELPGSTFSIRTPFVVVSNNRYSGQVLDSSLRAQLDQGKLWLYTTRVRERSALVRLAWQTLIRRIDGADDLESHPLVNAVIRSDRARALPIAVDGEVLPFHAPLRFCCRPGALCVLVPAAP